MEAVAVFLPALPSSWRGILLVLATAIVAYISTRVIHNLFISPLSNIPGPWYAACSDIWMTTHALRLRQCKVVHKLFQRYGPIVRIGPNKIAFCDFSTMRNVYTVQRFDKSSFYEGILMNENGHAMTTLEHIPHSILRKAYAPHYNPVTLAQFQSEMHQASLELVENLQIVAGKKLECLTVFHHFMVDVIVMSIFGSRHGAMSRWAAGTEDALSTAINDIPRRFFVRSLLPNWLWSLAVRVPGRRWKEICDSDRIMAEFASQYVHGTRARITIGESDKVPLVQRLLNHRYPSTNELMPDRNIISECMGHMVGGTDTISTSLAYFFWELSRRADIMKRLQSEIDEAMHDAGIIPDINVLQELPYLDAFIKEGLRLYTAAPTLLERVVPTVKGGASSDEAHDFNLMGYNVPPGTIVSTQAWSMHRDPSVFPSPEAFRPERWLEGSTNSNDLKKMNQHMIPFGTGSRVCGGQNLGMMMMRIVVTAIVRNFDIVAPPETNEASMDIRDSFVIFPASMECKLSFEPRLK